MTASPRRALPIPPGPPPAEYQNYHMLTPAGGLPDLYAYDNPYDSTYPYPPFVPHIPNYDEQPTALRGGTLLHKGFYDLLSLIPSTPSPSRLFWRDDPEPIAGPKYEDLARTEFASAANASLPAKTSRGRKISKDMVSKPTGFVYVCDNQDT